MNPACIRFLCSQLLLICPATTSVQIRKGGEKVTRENLKGFLDMNYESLNFIQEAYSHILNHHENEMAL